MNRRRTAYSIARTGHAVARGDHLLAANQASICSSCTGTCNQGRDCPGSTEASRRAARRFVQAILPYLVAIAVGLAWGSVPVYIDAVGPLLTGQHR